MSESSEQHVLVVAPLDEPAQAALRHIARLMAQAEDRGGGGTIEIKRKGHTGWLVSLVRYQRESFG